MKFNIFRNPFIDAQVSFLMDALDHGRRKETERYWRDNITNEFLEKIETLPKENNGCCVALHYCDVINVIDLTDKKYIQKKNHE